MTYPIFTTGIQVLWRSRDEVQFGVNPQTRILASAAAADFLIENCSGTKPVSELLSLAQAEGFDLTSIRSLLARLLENGFLTQRSGESIVENLQDIEIVIKGAGRLGTTVAILLAETGIANIRIIDSRPVGLADITAWGPSRIDVGMRRDHTALLLLERTIRGSWPRMLRPHKPVSRRLAILCPEPIGRTPWFASNIADELMAGGQPYLVASTGAEGALVSTVLTPGSTACVRCYHCRLTDLDHCWPLLSSQLIGRSGPDLASARLILHVAHLIVELTIDWLANPEESESGIYSMAWPSLTSEFSPISAHLACGCQWDKAG
ncbi:MAG: hypothetical protein EBS36_01870 [Actinobacteria bacterium]|nr:hypothetical protein [Actinomycetota bacterium]NBY15255.1 hypothetical protein [Actinomycetota bacterium]